MSKKEEGIFARFDARKQAVKTEDLVEEHLELAQQQQDLEQSINELTDEDMPDIETLNQDSDYSMFMSNKVSDALRKKALRSLFLSPSINVLDGLNDYDENYTLFELLGDIIPYDLKQQLARKSKEIAEKVTDTEDAVLEQVNTEESIEEQATEEVDDNATKLKAIKDKGDHDQ